MLRKTMIALTSISLMIALAFSIGGWANAAPVAQATPTMDPDMNMNMNMNESHDHDENDTGDDADHMDMGGERLDAGGASVRIIAPSDGATLAGISAIVKVETTGFALGEDGNHFHLYVDGKEQGMSQGNSDTIAANDLEPGEHSIEVVLTNGLHQELNATDMITIRTETAGEPVAAGAGDNSAVTVVGIIVAAAVVAGAGFMIVRKR